MNPRQTQATGKLIIGLIGGVGAGKSLVADRLRAKGALVIDADRTGHEVLRQPEVVAEVARTFGEQVLGADGHVDRRRLAAIVFRDAEQLRRLERIVHPVMLDRFQKEIEAGLADEHVPLVVLDAAILLEVGWDAVCNRVVFVHAPREVRLERLQRERGWSEEDLTRREAAQWPIEQKKARADVVISNAGAREACLEQVDRLFEEWTSGESPPPAK